MLQRYESFLRKEHLLLASAGTFLALAAGCLKPHVLWVGSFTVLFWEYTIIIVRDGMFLKIPPLGGPRSHTARILGGQGGHGGADD